MNDDLFASNIKIQNKIFVNFFVFAKTSKQNRTIFVKKIIRNNKKTKKKSIKTTNQGKSGKSKHKNIETVNSWIDGLFFVFIFVFAPPQGPNILKTHKNAFAIPEKHPATVGRKSQNIER